MIASMQPVRAHYNVRLFRFSGVQRTNRGADSGRPLYSPHCPRGQIQERIWTGIHRLFNLFDRANVINVAGNGDNQRFWLIELGIKVDDRAPRNS